MRISDWSSDVCSSDLLRARGNRLQGQWQVRADESLAALWSSPGAGDGPVAARDLDFLRWRFDQSPLAGTRYLVVRDRDGGLHAWFACETREHGLHVLDFRSEEHTSELPSLIRIS